MSTSRSTPSVASFDCFQIDLTTGDLRRADGKVARIQQLPLQVLRLLLLAEGKAVTREELRQTLWPDQNFVDSEHGVNTAVRKLRQALADSVDSPRFIETIPKVGYRFLQSVEWSLETAGEPACDEPTESPDAPTHPRRSATWKIVIPALVLGAVTLFLALAYFNRHRDAVHQKDANNSTLPREQRMTTNPEDTPVTSGLISPDGKYLAYTDKTGFYLRMVDGGETHSVPLEKGFDTAPESWFPDSVHLVVSRVDDPQRQPSLWQVSVFGGPPRKLTDAGYQASVSPDGSQILFLRHSGPSEEVWLMRADGLEASKIVASNKYTFSQLAWAPDGRRFAYARTTTRYYTMRSGPDTQVEIMDLRSHQITVVGMEGQRGLPRGGAAVGWLPDGRLIFPVREPRPNQQDTNLWWIRIDPQTSQPIGSRTRITIDHGIAVQLSISADGKRMALRRHAPQSDIFVSEIRNGGAGLSKPQRLTLDDRNDNAMAWTADSNTVIFYSNRDGPWHVFKQRIDSSQAELLVGGPDDLYLPRMTPDGKNVLYVVRAKPGATSDDAQLMRVPVEGGVSQFVLKAPGLWDVECARLPSRLCMYSQILAGHQTFYRFNPDAGEAAEYRAAEMAGDNFNWILAPDGQHLAWSTQQDPSSMFGIRILNLDTGKTQQIPIAQWADIFGVDWAADSKSLWLAARNSGGWSAVLHVQMNGKISNVLNFRNNDFDWVIPSPDGRRLAIVQEMNNSNVWLLENF